MIHGKANPAFDGQTQLRLRLHTVSFAGALLDVEEVPGVFGVGA